jgi:hydrogenase-1 operon protein HyaF
MASANRESRMSESANRKLQSIRVRTEMSSGNVAPLLHEIRHALARLVSEGASNIIDLQTIPLAPGEADKILAVLGTGEVHAKLQSLGESEIRETSFPGVWVVTHYDEMGDLKSRFIEVTRMPEILQSQEADIADGLERLDQRLRTT